MKVINNNKQLLTEIEIYISQIQGYCLDLYRILEYSLDTNKLVSLSLYRDPRLHIILETTNIYTIAFNSSLQS